MKKFLIVLLVGLLFLFLVPEKALAKVGSKCCGNDWTNPSGTGWCSIANLHIYEDSCTPRSGADAEACDLSSQICLLQGQIISVDNTAPTCPIGYTNLKDYWDAHNIQVNWDYKQGLPCCNSPFNILDCNNSSHRTLGQVCNIRYKFDPTSGRCVVFSPSIWSLSNTTCQGVAGIDTAIGCVPTGDLKLFIAFILRWVFFASGAVILLLIISTGFTIITSSGDPEKLQGAQENIIALFSGLALIAFSLVLLQAIGADILNLKAFKP